MVLDRYFRQIYRTWHPVTIVCYLLPLLLNLRFNLPRRPTNVLLAGLRNIIRLMAVGTNHTTPMVENLPKDQRTILSQLDLDPKTRRFVCCPTCCSLYDTRPLPLVCTARETPDSEECGTNLWRTRLVGENKQSRPIREYLHQEMKEWVARLLSRPGIEELLDDAHKGMSSTKVEKRDIWDGPILHKLSYKGTPFVVPPPSPNPVSSVGPEARLIFSLSVDGFNPFQNKESKQQATSTAIYMVCLNLPPHLRFLPENLFLVGVAPGPNKLTNSQFDKFLVPLVDDLLELWEPGVYFSRTARYSSGRLVRCALAVNVSDVPAARQVGGFSSVTSENCCHFCWLSLADLENFDPSTWPPSRDLNGHRELALQWKEADSSTRAKLYKKHGVVWSPLLDLPYWDPIRCTVVDSMHNHYLGMLKNHCREVWGMNLEVADVEDADLYIKKIPARPPAEEMARGLSALQGGERTELESCTKNTLWYLCFDHDLRRSKRQKKYLINVLLDWVSLCLSI